jgi:hypothetical protein
MMQDVNTAQDFREAGILAVVIVRELIGPESKGLEAGPPPSHPIEQDRSPGTPVRRRMTELRELRLWSLGEDLGEVFGSCAGVLGDLFAAAEAVADDDGFGVGADGGEEDSLA